MESKQPLPLKRLEALTNYSIMILLLLIPGPDDKNLLLPFPVIPLSLWGLTMPMGNSSSSQKSKFATCLFPLSPPPSRKYFSQNIAVVIAGGRWLVGWTKYVRIFCDFLLLFPRASSNNCLSFLSQGVEFAHFLGRNSGKN